jgi:hypothetical protein
MTPRAGWISRLSVSLALSLTVLGAAAQETIKIGEINSYKAQPAFLGPYKNGWNLALDEVNASGGVLGKKLEVVSRDDNANPGDTVLPRRRTADRQDRLGRRQQIHVPSASFHLHAGCDAGAGSPQAA